MDYLKQNHLSILIIAFLVVSYMFGTGGMPGKSLGAFDRTTVVNPWTFSGAVTNSSTLTQTGDATFGGGDNGIVVTSANTATSSIEAGCITTYATSTDTAIKQTFFASSTLNIDGASITSGFGGSAVRGLVLWGYGSCP